MSEGLFGPLFVPDEFREATGDRAWLQAMLDAEGALAVAQARAGMVPDEAARQIAERCVADRFDAEEIGRAGRAAGNPVPALVKALTAAVGGEAARYVHKGATSQDILDTAAVLVARGALDLIRAELERLAAAAARLAAEHRATVMPGRTLLQQALPTTFGLKAAGWLVSALEARRRLLAGRGSTLAVQLGGAAGTLAALGPDGLRVLGEFARELGLAEPAVPWHTDRLRIAELGGTLALVAGVAHKVALDVVLLAQTEVGEVSEPAGGGRGVSSTLPHKRNPILSVTAIASATRVRDLARTLLGALAQEHERAAGSWHAEWEALSDALALTGGAVAAVREALEGLRVRPERMRANLDVTGGLLLAENVTTLVSDRLGRLEAHELVQAACRRTLDGGRPLREELLAEPALSAALAPEEIDAALDPERYLGSAGAFVDRALEMYREEVSG
jgi:3-carboxy-cis,cis-muconate cycloisomerase